MSNTLPHFPAYVIPDLVVNPTMGSINLGFFVVDPRIREDDGWKGY